MSENIDCPYCSTQIDVTVQDEDVTTRYVRCNNCGGIFEHMPGFGTFSLPDRGAEFSRQIRTPSRIYPGMSQSIDSPTVQSSGGFGGCCILLLIIIAFFITGLGWIFFP